MPAQWSVVINECIFVGFDIRGVLEEPSRDTNAIARIYGRTGVFRSFQELSALSSVEEHLPEMNTDSDSSLTPIESGDDDHVPSVRTKNNARQRHFPNPYFLEGSQKTGNTINRKGDCKSSRVSGI